MIDKSNFQKIKPGTLIINTSRGPVIDNAALLEETEKKNFKLILDVWEDEPAININLLNKTKVGTAHIAGYSYEGKVNGTKMIYNSLCRFLNVDESWHPNLPEIANNELKIPEAIPDEKKLYNLFKSVYNIERDDLLLRTISEYSLNELGDYFDKLRKDYPVRREFSNYTVKISEKERKFKFLLENFRFKVEVI